MTGPFCKAVVLLPDDIENNEKGGGDTVKAFPLFVTSLGKTLNFMHAKYRKKVNYDGAFFQT